MLAGLLLWLVARPRSHLDSSRPAFAGHEALEQLPVVSVVHPAVKPAVSSITLPASVEAMDQATLYAKVSGYVQWIRVDKGDQVRKGDVLALLEVPEVDKQYQSALAAVRQAEAEEERAQAETALKQVTYKRLTDVRQGNPDVLPQQDVDTARAAYQVAEGDAKLAKAKTELARAEVGRLDAMREFAKIRAPFDGIVTARFVDPGVLIQEGSSSKGNPVLTVENIDTVRIYVAVPEPSVPRIDRGKAVTVFLNALAGEGLQGKITRFANALDPQTRTMKTEIDLRNPGHHILPGMYGTVQIKLAAEAEGLFVPDAAIRHDANGKPFVFTVEQGRLRKVFVEVGTADGGSTQVSGLKANQTVVLSGTLELAEGLPVRTLEATP
jgi:membrane fusion protein, multidrug efflux system